MATVFNPLTKKGIDQIGDNTLPEIPATGIVWIDLDGIRKWRAVMDSGVLVTSEILVSEPGFPFGLTLGATFIS